MLIPTQRPTHEWSPAHDAAAVVLPAAVDATRLEACCERTERAAVKSAERAGRRWPVRASCATADVLRLASGPDFARSVRDIAPPVWRWPLVRLLPSGAPMARIATLRVRGAAYPHRANTR